jgi:transposase
MEVVHECCAGLDVHKDEVVACARVGSGSRVRREHGRFGTTTSGLMKLSAWLSEHGCTHVVMEATGVYWKPVWHVLEGSFELTLANARDVKNMPGRKSDTNDATWLADLHAHGLVRGGFVPPKASQEMRDLTRTRKQLTREIVRHTQRIQKTLEDANVKLSSVLSNTLGDSGRRILAALIDGETDPVKLAALASSRVKAKREDIIEALRGRVSEHHRFMLRLHLDQIAALEKSIERIDRRIEEMVRPFQAQVDLLTAIPGISLVAAYVILAEIGVDMSRFPSAAHLVSWAGLCPRMDESAGKRRSTRVREGNSWLKTLLVQIAWCAARTKNSYLRAQFHRIKSRRGPKKAAVAVAASILTIAYHVLRDGTVYQDLGATYFDERDKTRVTTRLLRRLSELGVDVEVRGSQKEAKAPQDAPVAA